MNCPRAYDPTCSLQITNVERKNPEEKKSIFASLPLSKANVVLTGSLWQSLSCVVARGELCCSRNIFCDFFSDRDRVPNSQKNGSSNVNNTAHNLSANSRRQNGTGTGGLIDDSIEEIPEEDDFSIGAPGPSNAFSEEYDSNQDATTTISPYAVRDSTFNRPAESPKRLRRINSLAKGACKYTRSDQDSGGTKNNLSRILLFEEGAFETRPEEPAEPLPQKGKAIRNGGPSNTRDENTRATDIEHSTDITTNSELPKEDQVNKRNRFRDQNVKTVDVELYSPRTYVNSESSSQGSKKNRGSPTKDVNGSQKGIIAACLLTGLNTQLLSAYLAAEHPEYIQAQIRPTPPSPSGGSVQAGNGRLNRSRVGHSRDKKHRLFSQRRAKSVDSEPHHPRNTSLPEVRPDWGRAASEPPGSSRETPSAIRNLEPDPDTTSTMPLQFQPEELKSKMADATKARSESSDNVYVAQLKEVKRNCHGQKWSPESFL